MIFNGHNIVDSRKAASRELNKWWSFLVPETMPFTMFQLWHILFQQH